MSVKVDRIRATMIRDNRYRYYATVMMNLEWEEDDTIRAIAKTNGKKIVINTEKINMCSDSEAIGVIVHEIAHIGGKHHLRQGNRDWELWSQACDYAINLPLLDLGIVLPPTDFIREDFRNMSAEQIYELLKKEQENNGKDSQRESLSGRGRCGTAYGEDSSKEKTVRGSNKEKKTLRTKQSDGNERFAPKGGFDYIEQLTINNQPLSNADRSQQEAEVNIMLSKAERIAKQAGAFPLGLEQLFSSLKKTETDWVAELRNFVQKYAKNDYTWMYPNRRYIHKGLYLPSLRSMEIGTIGIIIDVSGSITSYQDTLSNFLSQLQTLLEELQTTATVLFVDTKIQKIYEDLSSEEITQLTVLGGGGTDFKPGIEWFNQNNVPDVLIYFTDLQCNSFPNAPDYPVLWATYGRPSHISVPFGTILHIK